MRHRLIYATCLGRGQGTNYNLDNEWKCKESDKEKYLKMFEDAIDTFPLFMDYDGLDFGFNDNSVFIGLEPSYAGEDLLVIRLDLKNKEESYMITGHAFGYYGTGIKSRGKLYKDYKRKSKFTNFIDKWFETLKAE